MDQTLEKRVEIVIKAYRYEVEYWRAMPNDVARSRERLSAFVHHAQRNPSLNHIVDAEIAILYRRLNRLREQRHQTIIH